MLRLMYVVQPLICVQLFTTTWTATRQASLSLTIPQSLPKFMSIELVMPSSHLVLCRPLLLLPSIFPSIRVFSNEPALHIRWPKYWSFSFSMSPSNEYSGLISFRIPGTVWKGKLYGSSIKFIIPDVIIRMAPWDCLQIKKNPLTLADC